MPNRRTDSVAGYDAAMSAGIGNEPNCRVPRIRLPRPDPAVSAVHNQSIRLAAIVDFVNVALNSCSRPAVNSLSVGNWIANGNSAGFVSTVRNFAFFDSSLNDLL